jgi:putative photosynthetic complex assembly protein 2
MSHATLAAVCAVLTWWGATGALLYIVRLPRATRLPNLLALSLLATLALWGLVRSADDTTATGAYVAFASAMTLWAWQEAAFLLGFVTGTRNPSARRDPRAWRRFAQAFAALRWHELAMAVGALLVVVLTWDAPNPIGAWTYLVLWGMRISAQLNLFLGVRNRGEELLPPHLRHLEVFFERRTVNPLWPLSVLAGAWIAWQALRVALADGASDSVVAGHVLVATLMALAVLEHLFMLVPVRLDALWARPRSTRP